MSIEQERNVFRKKVSLINQTHSASLHTQPHTIFLPHPHSLFLETLCLLLTLTLQLTLTLKPTLNLKTVLCMSIEQERHVFIKKVSLVNQTHSATLHTQTHSPHSHSHSKLTLTLQTHTHTPNSHSNSTSRFLKKKYLGSKTKVLP